MSKAATAERVKEIRTKAEEVALELVKNDLKSDDPAYAPLCAKLERFRPFLKGNGAGEDKVRSLLKTGLSSVRFRPSSRASDDDEVLRMLDGLADKLGGFASMFGGLS